MNEVFSFDPVYGPVCTLLILGSCPSVASLASGENYGHPRNRFWPVISELLGENCPAAYDEKKAMLLRHGIALWDVVGSCKREGSLDSAIRDASINNIPGLLEKCPLVTTIAFNGRTAYDLFLRHHGFLPGKTLLLLPSTSPIPRKGLVTYEDTLIAWREKLSPFIQC